MKHDLINKLNSIKLALELLKKDLPQEKRDKILNSSIQTIQETLEIIKKLK